VIWRAFRMASRTRVPAPGKGRAQRNHGPLGWLLVIVLAVACIVHAPLPMAIALAVIAFGVVPAILWAGHQSIARQQRDRPDALDDLLKRWEQEEKP